MHTPICFFLLFASFFSHVKSIREARGSGEVLCSLYRSKAKEAATATCKARYFTR